MKAVGTQNGNILIAEVEKPLAATGHVLIRTEYSAISPGTELGFKQNPSDQLVLLGYSAMGIVEAVGEGVESFRPGDRVACYGAPYVKHAEWLNVPANLVASVPNEVSSKEAAFAGLGAIAIHALRVAKLQFGESVLVIGLGILGNIVAQIANAAAYRTIGTDLMESRVQLLKSLGLNDAFWDEDQLVSRMDDLTRGTGVDAVVLCASGPGKAIINQSLRWIRDRGKIVIVGNVTMEFDRGLMFGKEAQVLISRAGGPGRYDAQYEQKNQDYPIGFVRWTEGRNVEEYIRLLSEQRIQVHPLITDIVSIDQASEAYEKYEHPIKPVGTLIQY